MEEKLLLSDYITKALEFEEHPEDVAKEQAVKDFLDKVIVRNYIPLKEKELLMMNILNGINKNFDAPGKAAFLEMSKATAGLLAYCVNVENDLVTASIMYSVYDICQQYGLYELILKYCKDDYQRLCAMIDNAVNIGNLEALIKTTSLFNQEEFDKWEKSIKELETHLNSEQFKEFKELAAASDLSAADLTQAIQEETIATINEEIAEDKEIVEKAIDKLNKNKIN